MDEKILQRLKKLQALAERGVGGEKDTAATMLEKLLAKNGISTLEELETEQIDYFLFSYRGKHEIALLTQCIYKVIGAATERELYRSHGTRQKIGTYCTKAQKIEIELEFEFYRNAFYEELNDFMIAFIQAQKIFPPDAPHKEFDIAELTPEDLKIMTMKETIKKKNRAAMIADVRNS